MGDDGGMTTANPSPAASNILDTPIGPIALWVDPHGRLTRVEVGAPARPEPFATGHDADLARDVTASLRAYFGGDLAALDDIDTATRGTGFQQRVWAALRRIPVGETASYADIAAEVGSPRAVRAVGRANATNPTGIVVPCHRVVRSDGTLGGYGGGLDRKRWLLRHEGAIERELVHAG